MDKMTINRYNYQEFFLLYTDNELKTAERKAVEDFVQQNPDLKVELQLLQHFILKPDDEIIFDKKESLLHFDHKEQAIHPNNFEAFAINYADKELNDSDKYRLEDFIRNNPNFQEAFDLIQSLKLPVDHSMMFPDKQLLYRSEKERKPAILLWWRMAAAAIILISVGLLWLNKYLVSPVAPDIVQVEKQVPSKSRELTTNTSGKEGKLDVHTDQSVNTAVANIEDMAGANKQNRGRGKKELTTEKATVRVAADLGKKSIKHVQEGEVSNQVTDATDRFESPMSAQVGDKSKTAPGNLAGALAIPSLDISYEKIGNQPELKINPVKNNNYSLASTVADTDSNENTLLLNIPNDRKNSFRGIIRKASRFIDKNTALRTPKKSGILIGNIEIAFQ